MENRNGLIVQADLTRADRHAETQGMKCASTAKRFQKHWATKVFALRLGHISVQLFLEKMPDIFDVFDTKRLRRRAKLNPNAILRPENDLTYAHYATKNMDLTEGLDSKIPEYVQLCVRKHALSF